jgi:hypothetical protein
VFDSAGGFDEAMRVCEDYDLWLRITAKHHVGLIDEEHVVKYGGHEDQLSRSEVAMDRFRAYALLKLLISNLLSQKQSKLGFEELESKSRVLAGGADKRGNLARHQLYESVANWCRSASRESGCENAECGRAHALLEAVKKDMSV